MIELRAAAVTVPGADGLGAVQVLAPTTLTLAERRIALIGANGSGKSTLARLINGLVLPSSGSVRVRTDEAGAGWLDTDRDGARVRRLVGFVFTNPATQLVMPTVIEDVALSLRRAHRSKPERIAAARAVLTRFGLETLADRSVHTLSGGQQQLLAIATVLATDPGILVADEPTTLLDLRNSRQIGELLLGLPQQLVVATHDLELAARCDRALVIDGGRVVFDSAAVGAAATGVAVSSPIAIGAEPAVARSTAATAPDAPGTGTAQSGAAAAVAWYRERA